MNEGATQLASTPRRRQKRIPAGARVFCESLSSSLTHFLPSIHPSMQLRKRRTPCLCHNIEKHTVPDAFQLVVCEAGEMERSRAMKLKFATARVCRMCILHIGDAALG